MPSVGDMGDVDDDDDCLIFPLTDIDNNHLGEKNCVESKSDLLVGRGHEVVDVDTGVRSRRRCKSFGCTSEKSHVLHLRMPSHSFSTAHHLSKINTTGHLLSPTSSSPKHNWAHAVRKIRHLKDPWERYHIIDLPSETATRHRYNPLKKQWIVDKVEVKMEREVNMAVIICWQLLLNTKF